MLGGPPQVPHSIDDFQHYLQTGAVALRPSYHSRLVADRPSLQPFAFAAASEGSHLAWRMEELVRDYESGVCTSSLSPCIPEHQAIYALPFKLKVPVCAV